MAVADHRSDPDRLELLLLRCRRAVQEARFLRERSLGTRADAVERRVEAEHLRLLPGDRRDEPARCD